MSSMEKWEAIAQMVIKEHLSKGECLFIPDAVSFMAKAAEEAFQASNTNDAAMNAMIEAVHEAEIYCPHEGVDRRAHFGIIA